MKVDVGVGEIPVKFVDQFGTTLGDMTVADLLANDGSVFTFDQGIVGLLRNCVSIKIPFGSEFFLDFFAFT